MQLMMETNVDIIVGNYDGLASITNEVEFTSYDNSGVLKLNGENVHDRFETYQEVTSLTITCKATNNSGVETGFTIVVNKS